MNLAAASTVATTRSSEKILRARPLPPAPEPTNNDAADKKKKNTFKDHKAYGPTMQVLRFAASELDPRLIALWPMQFQRSIIRAAHAVASLRTIKFNDIVAAIVELCLLFTFATTFAATIFNEAGLTNYVALGTGCTLMAIIWVQGSFALFSDNGISIGGPEITPTVMLAAMASDMKKFMLARDNTFNQEVMLTTMLALIIITTTCFGVVIYTLGRLKLSKIVRLIPAAVLSGYMASIGYLVTITAMKTSMPAAVFNAGPSNGMWFAYFIPAVAAGLPMYYQRRWKIGNPTYVLPFILFSPIVLFYIIVYGSGSDVTKAAKDGWLFLPFRSEVFYNQFVYSYGSADRVDWDAISYVAPSIFVMMFVVTLEAVMKQAATKKLLKAFDMRIDHELMLVGKANILCSLFVGAVGYPQPKLTYVNYSIVRNTTTRVGGMLIAFVVLILFFASFPLVNYLPRFWLSAVLIFAAAGFVIDNLYDGLWIYTKKEYFCIVAIVCINATVGMAWAVVGGAILSGLFFALSYSLQGSIKSIIPGSKFHSNVLRNEQVEMKLGHLGQRVLVIQLHRFVFFGNASYLNEVIMGLIKEQEKFPDQQRATHFVFDWAHVDSVDITAASVIYELVSRIGVNGRRRVYFTGLDEKLQHKLKTSIAEIHDESVRAELPIRSGPEQRLFTTLDDGVEFVEEQLLSWSQQIRQRWFKLQALEDFHAMSQLKNSIEMWQDLEFFSVVQVPKAWTLCQAGVVDENLYVLKEGTLVIYQGNSRAHVLKPGAFINEAALCHQAMAQNIVADEDSIVLALSREDMSRLECDFPAVSFELHRKVLDHSVRTREKIAMRLAAFKLWSRERVSRLAQANAVVPSQRSIEGLDVEAGPDAPPLASVEPTTTTSMEKPNHVRFDVDLKASLLPADSNDESALHSVRDNAGEEYGRDLAQQLFGEDDEDGAVQVTYASRMKRHSSAVSQMYAAEEQQNNDVASAIFHLMTAYSDNSNYNDAVYATPEYHLCPILARNLQAAFEANATRQTPSSALELAPQMFPQTLMVVGICYRGSSSSTESFQFSEFCKLAVQLTSPALDPALERKLAVFSRGERMSELELRRALPMTSALAVSRFVNLWDADGSRTVEFSSLCSAVAQHLRERELRARVQAEWNQFTNGVLRTVTVDDVARTLECTTLQAQEMVWEADWGRRGEIDLIDVVETISL